MLRSLRRFSSVAILLFAAHAHGEGTRTTIDCNDPDVERACAECGGSMEGKIGCCISAGRCDVKKKPDEPPCPPLQVHGTEGTTGYDFSRTGTLETGIDVVLSARFLPEVFDQPVTLKAHLTGRDAQIASLLYPIWYMRVGNSASELLRAQGFEFDAKNASAITCQQVYHDQPLVCAHLANKLVERIDDELSQQDSLERVAFKAGIRAVVVDETGPATWHHGSRKDEARPKK